MNNEKDYKSMPNNGVYFFKCDKCGNKVKSHDNVNGMLCARPMLFRTSGVCGGSYHKISGMEYNAKSKKLG